MGTRIEGFLRTLSPIHQTKPVQGFFNPRNPNVVSFTKLGKGSCNVMMSSEFIGDDGRPMLLPFVTGNSLRGPLRRASTRLLLDALAQPIRTELFQILSAGAAGREGIGGTQTALLITKARANVFAGLYGGGPSMLRSGYTAADMFPVHENLSNMVSGWVKDAARPIQSYTGEGEDRRPTRLTNVYLQNRRDPMLDGEGVSYVHEHDKAFMEYQAEVNERNSRRAAAKEADENAETEAGGNLKMMSYVEALVPGVPLNFSVTLKDYLGDAHVGLMLLSLHQWVNGQAMAGMSRRGFGRFQPNLRLYSSKLEGPVDVFQVVGGDTTEGYKLNDDLKLFVDAAQDALAQVTLAELEDIYLPPQKDGDGKKVRKGKKGAPEADAAEAA